MEVKTTWLSLYTNANDNSSFHSVIILYLCKDRKNKIKSPLNIVTGLIMTHLFDYVFITFCGSMFIIVI